MTDQSVLVLKASSMGDVIHTLPAVHALAKTFPQTPIRWLVNTEWAPLLAGNSDLEEVIEFPRRDFQGVSGLFHMRRWARRHLGSLKPRQAIDFQGLLRSALLCKASKAEEIIGYRAAREGASLFYDRELEIRDWAHLHAVARYLRLAEFAGADTGGDIFSPLPKGEIVDGFGEPDGFVLLHPFSRGRGKSLSFQEVIEFCDRAERRVVIAGHGFEWPEDIPIPENAISLLNKTSLPQLIWLMRKAGGIVSVDSGPMHLAAALSDRVLGIHTWTDPLVVGPYRKDALVWRSGQILPISEIVPGQFPEDRSSDFRDKAMGERLLPEGTMTEIASAASGLLS